MFLIYNFIYNQTGWSYQNYFLVQSIPGLIPVVLVIFLPKAPSQEDENELDNEKVTSQEKLISDQSEEDSFFKVMFSPLFIGYCLYYAPLVMWCNLYIGTIYDQVSFTGVSHEIRMLSNYINRTGEQAVQIFTIVFT